MTARQDENIAVLTSYFAAMREGGPAAAARFYAPDVELIVPGSHPAAGHYSGLEGIGRFGAAMAAITGGTFRLVPIELFASDDRVVTYATASATVDGRAVEWNRVIVTEMRDGLFGRLQFFEDDQTAVDRALGSGRSDA
jgi:ketosteroid isomerase-like protein